MGSQHWKLLIVLCLLCSSAVAQNELRFQHYGKEQGLSQASASCLLQDSRGYMWVGTAEGLNRYNGSEFVSFLPDHADSSLAGSRVSDIVEDPSGNLWIATHGGLSRYDVRKHEFRNFRWSEENPHIIPTNAISCLLPDSQYVWIGTNFGLGRINTEDFTTEIWRNDTVHQDSILKGHINSMVLEGNKLFLMTSLGISIYNKGSDEFTNIQHDFTASEAPPSQVTSLLKDSSGTYWVSTIEAGFARLSGSWDHPVFETFRAGDPGGPAHNLIHDMDLGPGGQLILSTYDGLTLVSTKDSLFSRHYRYDGSEHSLSNNQCYEAHLDKAGRLWVGTGSGLNVADPYYLQFKTLSHIPGNSESIIDDMVYALQEDYAGNLWVGTFNQGITIIDTRGRHHHIGVEEGLSTTQVIAFEEFQDGVMWVGTFNGIDEVRWSEEGGIISINRLPDGPAEEGKVPSPYIYDLQRDGDRMWVVTYGAGVFYLDPLENSGGIVPGALPKGVREKSVGYCLYLQHDRLWVGYQKSGFGFIDLHADSMFFNDLGATLPDVNSLSIMSVHVDSALWLGTENGLVFFSDLDSLTSGQNPVSKRYSKANGAYSNTIYEMIPDDFGFLWMSTTDGILKWDKTTNTGRMYNQSIGLKNNEFNKGAAVKTRDGHMYMGGIAGFVTFDPEKVLQNDDAPNLRLKELQLFNSTVDVGRSGDKRIILDQDIDFVESVTLKHSDDVFSLVFDAINFRLPGQTTYAYQLVGLQDDWITTEYPLATFTNLDAGDYRLLFRAGNNDGVWCDTRQLQITILPPWWLTWWAFVVYVLLIGVAIWSIIHLRVRAVKKVEQVKRQTRESFRKRSRQDFHDEAGNKLTRIALITQVARQQSNDEAQSKLIDELDENIKELESGMRDFIWVLNPEEDNLYDTMQRVRQFARSMYEYTNTQFSMEEPPHSWKEIDLNMERRRNLMMIFKEGINNSVKYAQASEAKIEFDSKAGALALVLKDDGVGFDIDSLSRRGGLDNMKKRAQRIDVKLDIKSKKNEGTQIHIIL